MKQETGNSVQGQEVRARLMEAALGLFSEKGYPSTSVREIVTQAGVTKPMLYYYFKNKEGLLRAILDRAMDEGGQLLARVMDMPGTSLERLLLLYRRVYEGVLESKCLFNMIHNLAFGPPQGAPEYDFEQYHRSLLNAIKKIYNEGVAKGQVNEADPQEVAVLVLSILDFCLHMDMVHPESSDPGRPERMLRLAFNGLAGEEKNK